MATFNQNNYDNAKGYQAEAKEGATVNQAETINNHITHNPEPKTPAEAAQEITDLLRQLNQENEFASDRDRIEYLRKALPPSRLQRLAEIIQAGGEAALEEIPGGKTIVAILKTVREQEASLRKAQES